MKTHPPAHHLPPLGIKQWYDTADGHLSATSLAELVCRPTRVNEKVETHGGRLDLIPSHLELINIDLDLAAEIGGGTWEKVEGQLPAYPSATGGRPRRAVTS